jgi:hypothetical protein
MQWDVSSHFIRHFLRLIKRYEAVRVCMVMRTLRRSTSRG